MWSSEKKGVIRGVIREITPKLFGSPHQGEGNMLIKEFMNSEKRMFGGSGQGLGSKGTGQDGFGQGGGMGGF